MESKAPGGDKGAVVLEKRRLQSVMRSIGETGVTFGIHGRETVAKYFGEVEIAHEGLDLGGRLPGREMMSTLSPTSPLYRPPFLLDGGMGIHRAPRRKYVFRASPPAASAGASLREGRYFLPRYAQRADPPSR